MVEVGIVVAFCFVLKSAVIAGIRAGEVPARLPSLVLEIHDCPPRQKEIDPLFFSKVDDGDGVVAGGGGVYVGVFLFECCVV